VLGVNRLINRLTHWRVVLDLDELFSRTVREKLGDEGIIHTAYIEDTLRVIADH
jgi:hypothetical protein